MLFSSNVFIFFFLPVALAGYQLFARFGRVAVFGWLSAVSLFFYGYWNPKYLLVLLVSIGLNFAASRGIAYSKHDRSKHIWLVAAVVSNLLLLGWYKYLFPLLGYFHASGWLARDYGNIVLPLGISFFTFTQIAYLIDLKQEMAEPQGLLSYVLFVTFFPHLIAGPIIHHSEMMPQFSGEAGNDRRHGLRADDLAVGITWFTLGLGKKVLIADRFGPIADYLYFAPHAYGAGATWVGTLAYAFQLYFDFSGYSDMALGLARMFSLTFPFNFNSPYKAASIIEFWQRFHMTLTRYLNLYLYNPMAMHMSRRRIQRGQKASKRAQRTLSGFSQLIGFPILATMFLAGIWHGAGMQFLLFGLAHGMYLTINHAWRTFVPRESKWQRLLPTPVSVGITFLGVLLGDVFFRAQSAASAFYMMGSMLGLHAGAGLEGYTGLPSRSRFVLSWPSILLHLAIVFAICWALPNTQEILGQVEEDERTPSFGGRWLRWQPNLLWAGLLLVLMAVTLTMINASTSFLYFQF
jgi:alginate O-acetyltransferase complex protein AlgI